MCDCYNKRDVGCVLPEQVQRVCLCVCATGAAVDASDLEGASALHLACQPTEQTNKASPRGNSCATDTAAAAAAAVESENSSVISSSDINTSNGLSRCLICALVCVCACGSA